MKMLELDIGIDPLERADQEAILRSLSDGTLLDPEIRRRVQARSRRIIDQVRRTHGDIDIEKLLF